MDASLDIRKITDCYYFLNRSCKKGDSCPYRHKDSILHVSTVCSYFPECNKGRDCEFRHPDPNMPQDTKPVCWFFIHQTCEAGNKCNFLHIGESKGDKNHNSKASPPKEKSILSRLKPKTVEEPPSQPDEIAILGEAIKKPKVLPINKTIMSRLQPKSDLNNDKEEKKPKRKRLDKADPFFDSVKKKFLEDQHDNQFLTSQVEKDEEEDLSEIIIKEDIKPANQTQVKEEKNQDDFNNNQGRIILEKLGFSLDDIKEFPDHIKDSILKASSEDEILEILNF